MRIGIIGAGRIALVHAKSIFENPSTTLSMIADPRIESATEIASRFGGVAVSDPFELIQSDSVDAVVVCSPTPFHADQVLESAKLGKPVLCEKPVAGSVEEAQRLVEDLALLGDPKVMVGFNRRFDPSFAAVKAAAVTGRLGTVEQVTIISRDPAAPSKEYMASSGGIFKDMTIHDFDMARFMLGNIVTVFAVGQNLDPELADSNDFDGAVITLLNEDGKSATITNSRHCATGYDQRLEVFGSDGAAFADNALLNTVSFSSKDASDAKAPFLDFFLERYSEAYRNELEAFVRVAAGEAECSPTAKDGLEALRLAEAASISSKDGVAVRL